MSNPAVWDFGDIYTWLEKTRRSDYAPLIVTCALNGGIQGREMNDALPETPAELAAQAKEAYDAGASIVHIHARNPDNLAQCVNWPEVFQEINARVREACPDLLVNNTTGGGPSMSMQERIDGLDARPELASLNLGPDMSQFRIPARPDTLPHPHDAQVYDECIPFTYGVIEQLAQIMLDRDVKPELEVYNPGQLWVTQHLLAKNLLEAPYLHQFVMGSQTGSYPTPENVISLVRDLPPGSIYAVCAIGPYQLPLTTLSTLMGGHVRVGLEDNIYYSRGRKLRGNGEAVERAVRIARELNREIATPAQARELLGVSAAPRQWELPVAGAVR